MLNLKDDTCTLDDVFSKCHLLHLQYTAISRVPTFLEALHLKIGVMSFPSLVSVVFLEFQLEAAALQKLFQRHFVSV